MRQLAVLMILWVGLVVAILSFAAAPSIAALPSSGWYIDPPHEWNRDWGLAVKLEPRKQAFQVTGILFSSSTNGVFPVSGTYYPNTNRLALRATVRKSTNSIVLDGKWVADEQVFDVRMSVEGFLYRFGLAQEAPGNANLSGTWTVGGSTMTLAQHGGQVNGHYRISGHSPLTGTIQGVLAGDTVYGNYSDSEGHGFVALRLTEFGTLEERFASADGKQGGYWGTWRKAGSSQ